MACTAFESGIINAQADTIWAKLKPFNFNFWGKKIKTIQVEEKDFEHAEVAGIHNILFTDGIIEKVKLLVVSDRHMLLKYEVLETSSGAIPADIKVTHNLKLRKITYTNQTVIEFSTRYSDKISLTKFIESKKEKKEFFEALRLVCTDPDDSGNKAWHCHQCTFKNIPQRMPNYKCRVCDRKHMFSKLFRIPCNLDKRRWNSPNFTMCGHEWRIILMPQTKEAPGWISAFLKCVKLNHSRRRFGCQFIFSTVNPSEARMANINRKKKAKINEDHWYAEPGLDSGFRKQCEHSELTNYSDPKGKWGLLIQMIPGDQQVRNVRDFVENYALM